MRTRPTIRTLAAVAAAGALALAGCGGEDASVGQEDTPEQELEITETEPLQQETEDIGSYEGDSQDLEESTEGDPGGGG